MAETARVLEFNRRKPRRGDALANTIISLAQGFMGGQQAAEQKKERDMKMYGMILENAERMEKIKTERQNQRVFGNFAKSMGLVDLDPGEMDTARDVAHGAMGGAKAPGVNTRGNRLKQFMEENGGAGISFGPGGFRFTMRGGKAGGKKDDSARLARARQLAADAAQRDWERDQRAQAVDPTQTSFGKAPNDMVEKYVPIYMRFLSGDMSGYEAEMGKIKKKSDPLGLAGGDIEDLDLGEEDLR